DGLSVLKKIRSHDHSSKIIILTGNDNPEIFNECTKLGVLAFLVKPFNLNDILDIISFSNEVTLMK
ncbi:MAG: two-component system response regulator, partial [Nitrosopumilus sp. CG10_big_fil_rev_8_21_14_0_10_33_7]